MDRQALLHQIAEQTERIEMIRRQLLEAELAADARMKLRRELRSRSMLRDALVNDLRKLPPED
jgi:hypothetical protein